MHSICEERTKECTKPAVEKSIMFSYCDFFLPKGMDSAENTEEHLVQRNVKYLTLTRAPKVSMRLMEASENKVTK